MRYVLAFLTMIAATPARGDDDLVLPSVDFSATAVHEAGPLETRETIDYEPGKLRIERGAGFAITILDFSTQSQYVLMVNRTYLVLPMDDELYRRFIARSMKMSGARKVGKEIIDGLTTTKYAFGDDGALRAAGFYWLTDNGIMVRRVYDDGIFGKKIHNRDYLTHITFAPQPAALFSIPAGYTLAK
jgi:hypothetical protein